MQTGTAYYFDHIELWKLWLMGHVKGQPSISPGSRDCVQACWPKNERARFEEQKKMLGQEGSAAAGTSSLGGSRGRGRERVKTAVDSHAERN